MAETKNTKTITIRLNKELYELSKEYGIDMSAAAHKGIRAAIEREKKIREAFPED